MRLNKRRRKKIRKKIREVRPLGYREKAYFFDLIKKHFAQGKTIQNWLDENKDLMDDLVKAGD